MYLRLFYCTQGVGAAQALNNTAWVKPGAAMCTYEHKLVCSPAENAVTLVFKEMHVVKGISARSPIDFPQMSCLRN